MSPVLKPRGPGQDGFRPWGVRTRTRLSRRGRSHRSVHSTAQPGHAAQRLQVGASLGSPGKPPLTRDHRLGRRRRPGAARGGRGAADGPCRREGRPSQPRSTGGWCPGRAPEPPGQGCAGRRARGVGEPARGRGAGAEGRSRSGGPRGRDGPRASLRPPGPG